MAQRFKVVLLGEGRVGKTSILLRYIRGEYDDKQVSTLQASYLDKKIVVDNKAVQLSLWDTAGQERFHALGPIYYRDADGALLVYDITDEQSFVKVKTWVRELRKIVGNDIAITIAGNKIDLEKSRHVVEKDALEYADSVGAAHYHTSAKLNKGLDDAFVDLAHKMMANKAKQRVSRDQRPAHSRRPGGPNPNKKLLIVDDNQPVNMSGGGGAKPAGGCC